MATLIGHNKAHDLTCGGASMAGAKDVGTPARQDMAEGFLAILAA